LSKRKEPNTETKTFFINTVTGYESNKDRLRNREKERSRDKDRVDRDKESE
jgi:hypothetical protein